MRTAFALIAVAFVVTVGRAALSNDSACELQCSIVYTREVRACEHEPSCMHQAREKYDACAQRCGGK